MSVENMDFMDTSLPIEVRVDDLVSRLTLEEKVSQTVHGASAIPRLGIPEYNWWNECLHGVARAGIATVFSQAIGMSASWNKELLHKVAVATSDEARAKHHEFARHDDRDIYKGLTFWSPNINIFRDPRWGRGHETYGEDPYLTGEMAVGFITGLQGDDPKYLKIVATDDSKIGKKAYRVLGETYLRRGFKRKGEGDRRGAREDFQTAETFGGETAQKARQALISL